MGIFSNDMSKEEARVIAECKNDLLTLVRSRSPQVPASFEELLASVKTTIAIASRTGSLLARSAFDAQAMMQKLTTTERKVLRYLLDGLSSKAIAPLLGTCSYRTVEKHRSHIHKKCGTQHQSQLVAIFG